MTATVRLALPFIAPGQAQKELFHNEALQRLDMVVGGAVEEPPRAAPPATPTEGACYIVASAPSGVWSGRQGQLAGYSSGGWRFVLPGDGLAMLVKTSGITATYRAGGWDLGTVRATGLSINGQQVVGSRTSAVAAPTGGSNPDAEARTTINQILASLRQHGLIET